MNTYNTKLYNFIKGRVDTHTKVELFKKGASVYDGAMYDNFISNYAKLIFWSIIGVVIILFLFIFSSFDLLNIALVITSIIGWELFKSEWERIRQ